MAGPSLATWRRVESWSLLDTGSRSQVHAMRRRGLSWTLMALADRRRDESLREEESRMNAGGWLQRSG